MDIANPNGRILADGMFFSCSNVIGFALFHGKITETQMTEETGTLEETETGTATETQQEPVIQTVKLRRQVTVRLGQHRRMGMQVPFMNTMINTGRIIFLKMSEVFLSRMILH